MSFLSLNEFRRLTGLSDSTLVALLAGGNLPVAIAGDGSLLVDARSVSVSGIISEIARRYREVAGSGAELLSAEVAALLGERFDEFLGEAIALLLAEKRAASPGSQAEPGTARIGGPDGVGSES